MEESDANLDLFNAPETFISEGGQEEAYRQGVCEIVAGVGLDDNEYEDEEAPQEELIPDGEDMEFSQE